MKTIETSLRSKQIFTRIFFAHRFDFQWKLSYYSMGIPGFSLNIVRKMCPRQVKIVNFKVFSKILKKSN